MAENKRILLIGSSNMDLCANMFRVPREGETVIDDGGVAYTPGGKGGNAAVAFKKLGGECTFLTKLGADMHGQKLFAFYKELGIDTSNIKVDHGNSTGFALILKESDGNNRIVYYPGANIRITTENLLEAFSTEPDALYIGFETSFETALSAAKIAAAKNIPIFLDAAPADRSYPLESLPMLEVFSPNESEAYEYTGIRPTGADNALRVCLALSKRVNAKYIILKLGERGAFVYDGKYHWVVPAYPVAKVIDTTGAGDAFTAALTLEYLRTGDIKSAGKFASCAGALTTTKNGASMAIPTREEVLSYMKKYSTI